MNKHIADLIAQSLIELPFINYSVGLVQEIIVDKKRLPVAERAYTKDVDGVVLCDQGGSYKDVIPLSTHTGLSFLEDQGARRTDRNKRFTTFKTNMKLVCWFNMKRIGSDVSYSDLQANVLFAIPKGIEQNGGYLGGQIRVAEVYPKRPSPFDRYTGYDETVRPFLILPYDYMSLRIESTVIVSNHCPVDVELNPVEC